MKLYIASTSGYSGKTLLALALSRIWSNGGVSGGHVKPLGENPLGGPGGAPRGEGRFPRRCSAPRGSRHPSRRVLSRPFASRHHLLPALPGPAARPILWV